MRLLYFSTVGFIYIFFSFSRLVSKFRANWPPQFGDLVSYLGEFLLFFDQRNFEAL